MGNPSVARRRNGAKNCADGAYGKKEHAMLVKACEGVLNWLRLSGATINGKTYGSDEIIIRQDSREELYQYICERYFKLTGAARAPFSVDVAAQTYSGVRKGNYELLRDGKPIKKGFESMPLFGVMDDDIPATLYAYWGANQKAGMRLVKVGYTTKILADYLRSLDRAYNPKLLAHKPGDYTDEQELHRTWSRFRAEGREWYYATEVMFDSFRRGWKVTEDFELLAEEALSTSPFNVGVT